LKAIVSLSHISWTCSCKTPVSIVAVGSPHNAHPWCGRIQLAIRYCIRCWVIYTL